MDRVKIDTAAKRKYIMPMDQYNECCRTFGLRLAIKPHNKVVTGIGGRKQGLRTATIQIPLPNLGFSIDINFLLMTGKVPPILCMREMVVNGL